MSFKDFEEMTIPLSDLLFDLENTRIYFSSPKSQKDALDQIMRLHGGHNYALAQHIAKFGLLDKPLITHSDKEEGKYIVKEGNRRLAAILCLLYPEKAGSKWKDKFEKIKKEAEISHETFEKIACRYSDDESLIEEYLKVRHGGQGEGIGTVRWTAFNNAMAKLKNGIKNKEARAAAVIRYANTLGCFTYDEKYPISTLSERITTKSRLKKLGIEDIFAEPPKLVIDEETIRKRICYIIKEIGDGRKDSRSLNKSEDADTWLEKIIAKFPAKKTHQPNIATQTKPTSPAKTDAGPQQTQTIQAPHSSRSGSINVDPYNRIRLFRPKDKYGVNLTNADSKTKAFFGELDKLIVDQHPMLAAIGLRVLLELATAHCEKKHSKTTVSKKEQLPERVKWCAKRLWGEDDNRTRAIINTVTGEGFLTLRALNQVVHNEHYPTTKKEVLAIWDKLRPYIASCFE